MATFSISWTVPDNIAAAIKDDFAAFHGYSAEIIDEQGVVSPNPETQNQFIKRIVGQFIKNSVIAKRANAAAVTARDSAVAAAESSVSLT